MTVFIAGVLTEAGTHAAKEMLKREWKVYGADGKTAAEGDFLELVRNAPGCYYVKTDFFNERSIQWEVAKVRPDLIMVCDSSLPAKTTEFFQKAAKSVGAKLV